MAALVSPFGTIAAIMLRHLLLPAEHAVNYRLAIPFSRYKLAYFHKVSPALQVSNSHRSGQIMVQTYNAPRSFYLSQKQEKIFFALKWSQKLIRL